MLMCYSYLFILHLNVEFENKAILGGGFYLYFFLSVSSLLSINAVELRDALTTNSNVTRGREKKNKQELREVFYPLFHLFIIQV